MNALAVRIGREYFALDLIKILEIFLPKLKKPISKSQFKRLIKQGGVEVTLVNRYG